MLLLSLVSCNIKKSVKRHHTQKSLRSTKLKNLITAGSRNLFKLTNHQNIESQQKPLNVA